MTTKQTVLIREASKKEVGAHRWRIRMEKWRELQWPPEPEVNWSEFLRVVVNEIDPNLAKRVLKPART